MENVDKVQEHIVRVRRLSEDLLHKNVDDIKSANMGELVESSNLNENLLIGLELKQDNIGTPLLCHRECTYPYRT